MQIAGVVRQPHGAWMTQVARNLTDGVDGFLLGKRYLLHDRDPLFTDAFRSVLAAAGVSWPARLAPPGQLSRPRAWRSWARAVARSKSA